MNSTALAYLAHIAPSFPQSPADKAAHAAASYVRPYAVARSGDGPVIPGPRGPVDHLGDSDPDPDELLRRVRSPRSNALYRLEVEAAYLERDALPFAEYRQYVDEVAA